MATANTFIMMTDNSEIVHVSGKETERIGTEAFVFIEVKGWEVLLKKASAEVE